MRNGVGLGVSTDMPSKQSAVDTALHDCIGKGGQACKIQLVYANQCGVIVEGDKGYGTARGPTVEEATRAGMKVCDQSDRNCQGYFSDCSHAARVR